MSATTPAPTPVATTTRSAGGHQKGSNRWLVLAVCCMSLFIVGIDVSGLNLALPSIQSSLQTTASELQWITDAYNIVLASLLMLSGSMGDRFGRKKVFMTGLVLFGAGSVLCAFAPSAAFLIAARGVQAIGGSMLNPVAMAIITNTFTDAKERAQAIGMWGAAIGLSTALGPLVGGVLVEKSGWQAIFWMNVPIVLAALVLTALNVPESRAARPRRFDPAGQALLMVGLGTLTYGIIEGRSDGWTSATVLTCLAVFVACVLLLATVERRLAEPVLNPRFFASWPFTGAVVSAVLGFMSMAGFLYVNTLYLQTVRHYSPITAGLVGLPMALCNGLFAPVSGRLVAARGPRLPLLLAGLLQASSALVLTQLRVDTPLAVLFVAYVLLGTGQGLLNAPITNSAVSGMPRAQAGVAAAVASTARQVGNALGVALFGTLTYGAMTSTPGSLAAASHSSWWLMACSGLTLAVLALVTTGARALRTGRAVMEQLDHPEGALPPGPRRALATATTDEQPAAVHPRHGLVEHQAVEHQAVDH